MVDNDYNLAMTHDADWIRATIAARAETLGMTAYKVAKLAGLNCATVKRFMAGRCSLNSGYVSRICGVLSLALTPGKARDAASTE